VYSIFLSMAIGIVVGVLYTLLGFWKTWAMGIILGILVSIVGVIVCSRVLAKRFEPVFQQAQKQMQSGASQLAMNTLESLLPLANWQILLKGQIYAQMGLLAYAMEKEDKALEYLPKAGLRVSDAHLALAAIKFRKKDQEGAFETMNVAIKANKKQMLPYNVLAFMQNKAGKKDDAIETLQRCLKIESSNENTKDNLLRLQNNRKMNMKPFGMQWYSLRLEKPPASMRQYPPGMHKGFRPKQRKQKSR